MTIRITKEDAERLLREAVQEKGADYVYPRKEHDGCYYAYNGKPSCIVGHVLVGAGLPVGELRKTEGLLLDGALPFLDVEIEDEAIFALVEAQLAQDNGRTWGEALAEAGVELP